jgi:hypothetical protein
MATVFHVGTYLSMGTDFDSRWRFLRNRADGVYEGGIASGETWNVGVDYDHFGSVALFFKMDGYSLDWGDGRISAPAGTVTRVSSE